MTGASTVNLAVRKTLLLVTPFLLASLAYLHFTGGEHAAARSVGAAIGAFNLIIAAAIGGWASKKSFTLATAITLGSFILRLVGLGLLFAYLATQGFDLAQTLISFAVATTICLSTQSVFLIASKE